MIRKKAAASINFGEFFDIRKYHDMLERLEVVSEGEVDPYGNRGTFIEDPETHSFYLAYEYDNGAVEPEVALKELTSINFAHFEQIEPKKHIAFPHLVFYRVKPVSELKS